MDAPLERVHTRKLLSVLRDVRTNQTRVNTTLTCHERVPGDERWELPDDRLMLEPQTFGFQRCLVSVSVAQVKEELAKREHVPSKLEGHLARKAAAQGGRARGRKDR